MIACEDPVVERQPFWCAHKPDAHLLTVGSLVPTIAPSSLCIAKHWSLKIRAGNVVQQELKAYSFSHTESGFVGHGGALKHFALAGADGHFVWAHAVIDGDTVVVTAPEVPAPTQVRYAWATQPKGSNLYNGAGLPAAPFRAPRHP